MIEVNEDEILLEQYYTSKNMNVDARNLCLYLISKSKEVMDSIYKTNTDNKFDIVNMDLNRVNNVVYFNGFISNNEENKLLEGRIALSGKKYYMSTNVYRLYEYLEDDERDYSLNESFEMKDGFIYRETMYNNGSRFSDKIEECSIDDVDYYIEEKIRRLRKK